jgi:hypothetical protein
MKLRFLNERETAEYLGTTPKTLQRWRFIGAPPNYHKINGLVRYDMEVLDHFLRSCLRSSTTGNVSNGGNRV